MNYVIPNWPIRSCCTRLGETLETDTYVRSKSSCPVYVFGIVYGTLIVYLIDYGL